MFVILSKEETEILSDNPKSDYSTKGMSAELSAQFSKMSFGESFIYPVINKLNRRAASSRIKGTCQHLGVLVRTKTVDDGILVVFEGYK